MTAARCRNCGQPVQEILTLPGVVEWRHGRTDHGRFYRWCRLYEATPETTKEAV